MCIGWVCDRESEIVCVCVCGANDIRTQVVAQLRAFKSFSFNFFIIIIIRRVVVWVKFFNIIALSLRAAILCHGEIYIGVSADVCECACACA